MRTPSSVPDSPDVPEVQKSESPEACFLRQHPGAVIRTRDVWGRYAVPGVSLYANERTEPDFDACMGKARIGYYLNPVTGERAIEVVEWIEKYRVDGCCEDIYWGGL